MRSRPALSALTFALPLLLLCLIAWRALPRQTSAPGPFVVGSTWHAPSGIQVKIEEVRGDWLRISTNAAMPGFPPSAIWIYAPTGQVWTQR